MPFHFIRVNISQATAQSVADKQDNLAAKIDEVTSKPADEVTQKDASELQSRQVSS